MLRTLQKRCLGSAIQARRSWVIKRREFHWQTAPHDWSTTMTQAEEMVGSPTTFATLRSLVGDEVAVLSTYAKKLMQTQHPMLGTAKACFLGESDANRQIRGLIVLLTSKAFNPQQSSDMIAVGPKQRTVAEIVELVHTATLIHSQVVTMDNATQELGLKLAESDLKDLDFGNKMAVLSGDMLLASACSALARLHDVEVVDMISRAIADISVGRFLNNSDWETAAYLRTGSLLSKSCRAAVKLGCYPDGERLTAMAENCGENFGYLLEIGLDNQAGNTTNTPSSEKYEHVIRDHLAELPTSASKDVLLRFLDDLSTVNHSAQYQ